MLLAKKRIVELDILRGLAIVIMIFVDSPPAETYYLMAHATWEGLTLADWAFPGFVFAMGASAAVSSKKIDMKKIFRRAGILFLIGILFNMKWSFFTYLFQENFTSTDLFDQILIHGRFFGILQRLALTYLLGMFVVKFFKTDKNIFMAAFGLLILSSAGFHIYSPAAPFAIENNISGAIDKIFPGVNHIYTPNYDPEGLYGTIASAAEFLFGFLAGKILTSNIFFVDKIYQLIVLSVIFFITGGLWTFTDIIAKNIWSAPFALITSGGEIILLAAMLKLFDKLPHTKKFFTSLSSLGKNPLFFFLISNILVAIFCNILVEGTPMWIWFWQVTLQGFISDKFSIMIFCLIWTFIWLPVAMIFDRLGIIIKI